MKRLRATEDMMDDGERWRQAVCEVKNQLGLSDQLGKTVLYLKITILFKIGLLLHTVIKLVFIPCFGFHL